MYKLENVELIDTLRNIVNAVNNHYKTDFVYDASTFRNSGKTDFLFMPRDCGVQCSDMERAYTAGTYGNTSWEHYLDSSEYKKAFYVHVDERKGNEVYGSIYEIDFDKSVADVKRFKQPTEFKDITFAQGQTLRYTPEQFDDNRYTISGSYGGAIIYDDIPANREELQHDIREVTKMYVKQSIPISPDAYYGILHAQRLSTDMNVMHVPSHDVYTLLTETHIPVFDVVSGKAVPVTLESYKASNYNSIPTVYAINFKDKDKFDAIDRKVLESNIKQYELENKKHITLSKYGYRSGNRYLLEGKEIEKAFALGIQVHALHSGGYCNEIYKIEAAKEFVKNGGLVGISTNYKEEFIKALKEGKQSCNKGIAGRVEAAKEKAAAQGKAPVDNSLNRESEAR